MTSLMNDRVRRDGAQSGPANTLDVVGGTLLLLLSLALAISCLYVGRRAGGLSNSCYDLLQRRGPAICGRVHSGALLNAAAQLLVFLSAIYLSLRNRLVIKPAIVGLPVSILSADLTIIRMNSWRAKI